jgi:metallo-beta-lactamase family protein
MAIQAIPIYDRYQDDFSRAGNSCREGSNSFMSPYPHSEIKRRIKEISKINYPAIMFRQRAGYRWTILHHLKHESEITATRCCSSDFKRKNEGRFLVEGAEVKIHGQIYPVRAQIIYLDALSAHVDSRAFGLAGTFQDSTPANFSWHGEAMAASTLAGKFGNASAGMCGWLTTWKQRNFRGRR